MSKSANIAADKRKDSLFRLVDTDDSGTIDAQEFAVLYDAIKKDLEEELEKQAALEKEASSATRRFKMLLLFVAVLVSFLAASVAANFAVIFTFVDSAITTATSSTGLLEVKGSDTIIKTAIATQDVPLMVAPALDMDTLAEVKSLKVMYSTSLSERVEAQLTVVGVRKHNSTFVEFVTSVPGETVEALNGMASLVRYPTNANRLTSPAKHTICSANATCSAFKARGIDVAAALDLARATLAKNGFLAAARRLGPALDLSDCSTGYWTWSVCGIFGGLPCALGTVSSSLAYFYTGYSFYATRHVVFLLHGWMGHAGHLWSIYCVFGIMWCPVLELDEFRHLVFAWPSSMIMGYYKMEGSAVGQWGFAWNPMLDDAFGFEYGAASLSSLMCGNPNAFELNWCWGIGWLGLFGVGADSEVMMVGYSNGGGLAAYANMAYGWTVTKAVTIDYHGQNGYEDWLPVVTYVSGAQGFHMKAYANCESWTFTTEAIWPTGYLTYGMAAGLVEDPVVYDDYGGWGFGYLPYRELSWTNPVDGRYLKFAVHGFDSSDECTQNMMAWGNPMLVHLAMPYFASWVKDVLAWVEDTGTPPPSPPSPPPSPPAPPSPAPPPFPPASTWFMGIKPVALPKPVATQGKITGAELAKAEKDFYGKSGAPTVTIEAKSLVKTIQICSRSAPPPPAKRKLMEKMMKKPMKGMPMEGMPMEDFHAEYNVNTNYVKSVNDVQYADDLLYRRDADMRLAPRINIEQLMIYEKEKAAALWQTEIIDGKPVDVPMFYFSSAIKEPSWSAPIVPVAPSPPPISTCSNKVVTIDAVGSAMENTAVKRGALKATMSAQFGPRRAIETLTPSTWTSSDVSYSKVKTTAVAMDDFEGLAEFQKSVDDLVGLDSLGASKYMGAKSIDGALKVAGKPMMSLLGQPFACFARETSACRLLQPAAAEYAYAACFGGSGNPSVAERVSMDTLVAGDTVLATEAASTRVVVNQHAGVKAASPMLTLHFEGGSLSLTPDHVLLLDGAHAPARLATVGSTLSSGRKVAAITRGQQGIINPITAAGTILAAGPEGEPVVAATAPEWSADVLLSGYAKYTLAFNLAFMFPASVQAFYDTALEPFFSLAVPRLEQIKAAAPVSAVVAGFALGDVLLAAGLFVFAFGKLAAAAAAAAAVARFVARKA